MTKKSNERVSVITEEMIKKTAVEMAKRKRPISLEGTTIRCPTCKKDTMEYRKDLCFDIVRDGEHIIIPNLSGHKCHVCEDEAYDAESSHIIDTFTRDRVPGGHEATITVAGGNKLGIYFPKDILRIMRIRAKIKVVITPLSLRKMIIELEESTARNT